MDSLSSVLRRSLLPWFVWSCRCEIVFFFYVFRNFEKSKKMWKKLTFMIRKTKRTYRCLNNSPRTSVSLLWQKFSISFLSFTTKISIWEPISWNHEHRVYWCLYIIWTKNEVWCSCTVVFHFFAFFCKVKLRFQRTSVWKSTATHIISPTGPSLDNGRLSSANRWRSGRSHSRDRFSSPDRARCKCFIDDTSHHDVCRP